MGLKTYLGDSVYADFDGYHIILTTENGQGPENEIFLELEGFEALERFVFKLLKKQRDEEVLKAAEKPT